MATELDVYDDSYSCIDSRIINNISKNKDTTFVVATKDGELPHDLQDTGVNVKSIKYGELDSYIPFNGKCVLILHDFYDMPEIRAEHQCDDVGMVYKSGVVSIDDDFHVSFEWGGRCEDSLMKPFIEIINKYETYISGSRFINYPISRDVFKRYDKIIITTIKFNVSHYKHFIEQYNIKVNKYTYLEG
jgi:hypothetical protein